MLAFPVIANQMWRFVAPGLYKSEKGAFLPFLVASPFMFFLGAAFAFYVVTPLAYDFFLGFQQFGVEPREAVTVGRGRPTACGRLGRLPGLGAGIPQPHASSSSWPSGSASSCRCC